MSTGTRGIILFAHGSRDPGWRRPVEAVAASMLAGQTRAEVRCAYLEHDAPDLAGAVDALVAGGARDIVVVPLFLGLGRHLREDLPRLVAAARARHPGVGVDLRPSIGEDARVVALIASIASE